MCPSETKVIEVDQPWCDQCPAEAQVQAYVYAEHPAWASPLAWCAHHGTQHMDALIAADATVVDLRHLVEP